MSDDEGFLQSPEELEQLNREMTEELERRRRAYIPPRVLQPLNPIPSHRQPLARVRLIMLRDRARGKENINPQTARGLGRNIKLIKIKR